MTSSNDRSNALRFLGYVQARHSVQVSDLVSVFASPRLPNAVQQFVEHMVNERGVKYSTAAKYVLSISCIAQFIHVMVKKTGGAGTSRLDAGALDSLSALHQQCVQQSRKQDSFGIGKPANWLDWKECQVARVHAERLADGTGEADNLDALHDVCLLTLLTFQPPDRVGVLRKLQLGGSLIPAGDAVYKLNIATPDAHKTAAAFGPTLTTMSRAVGVRIKAYIEAAGLKHGHFLFYEGDDASKALEPYAWTRLVKRVFKAHSVRGVALAPKELRAAFVTFLKSNECPSDTLKAAPGPCGTRARCRPAMPTTRA